MPTASCPLKRLNLPSRKEISPLSDEESQMVPRLSWTIDDMELLGRDEFPVLRYSLLPSGKVRMMP